MALYSIRENTDEVCVVASAPGLGPSMRVVADTERLPERADELTGGLKLHVTRRVRGLFERPHNIIRTVCEFALEEQHGCDVYLDSPARIRSDAYDQATSSSMPQRCSSLTMKPSSRVCERLGCAADAADSMRIARAIGLEMSERTAHRILSGRSSRCEA